MEIVYTAINAAVVAAVGLVLGWFAKGRFEAVQQQFHAVQKQVERMDARIDDLQTSFDAIRSQFQGSLDAMR